MEWNLMDGGEGGDVDDLPTVVRSGEEQEFRVEIGFQELEIVAFVGSLKIVGIAHFGVSGRAASRRASDYLRHFSDSRLTLSRVRIYEHRSGELVDTSPYVILNLDRADFVYARDAEGQPPQPPNGEADAPADAPERPAEGS